ncbi:DUF4363 family protein [Alteribacillus sp. JSM 102045]|uniref:DUF4363 family protein n=1 Tax=Alteribacillus sp. JSM 102045 TaxID=1562101 RepID=UPI0035C269A1
MKKFLLYFIPCVFIISTFVLMTSGGWMKNSFNENNNVISYLENMEHHIKHEEWNSAKTEQLKAQKAWEAVSKRIQYSVERADMQTMNQSLSKIKGGIENQDTSTIFPELYYFYDAWDKLG